MIKASEVKKGKVVNYEGQLYTVTDVTRVSKGNWRSYLQAKLKSIKTGQIMDARWAVDDKIETPFVESKSYEFLYRDGSDYVLMDQSTFDQIHVTEEVMGDANLYLKGNESVQAAIIDGNIVSIELPNTVDLTIVDTPPVIKGATATNQTKDADLETGLRIKVPPFISPGEVVRVDTRTGEYLERAKG
ncbi:MAG: elongation factor P [Phycisphaerae bacterium]